LVATLWARLRDTLRRQLGISPSVDLAQGFRRRLVEVAKQLDPGDYTFVADRGIAQRVVAAVARHAAQLHEQAEKTSTNADDDSDFTEFSKTFRTMRPERLAMWASPCSKWR
jgi:hypothetical protein